MKPLGLLLLVGTLTLGVIPPGLVAAAVPEADAELIRAAYAGDLALLQRQLRRGASFNARDENGYTPLHWAAFRGDTRLVRYMLDRGATIDVADLEGVTPLMLAAWNGHADTVTFLLARGADRLKASLEGFLAYDYAGTRKYHVIQGLLGIPPSRALAATRLPTASPLPMEEPTASPLAWLPASPSPVPSPSPPAVASPPASARWNEVSAVAGVHLSRVNFPIIGVHYRRTLHDWFSIRAGYEAGRYAQAVGAGSLELGYSRISGALLTNGWLYGGLGLTHVTLGTVYTGGFNPSRLSYDLIAGTRYTFGFVGASAEFRFGIDGPSTTTGSLSGLF